MKETPLLFTPENVRKVLAGTKTQTRRIVKPQPNGAGAVLWPREMAEEPGTWLYNGQTFRCPYGQPGDRLWVREAWASGDRWMQGHECDPPHYIWYKADNSLRQSDGQAMDTFAMEPPEKWRPSIYMPKWACRLWLEIVSVRVERLQKINREDAIAEGMPEQSPMTRFAELWESINGPGSWDANPWVWALTFKRVQT